ncbi:MAG: magnesium transporter [Anaerolineales bacterium]|nr:magnesium transporter [Anaerolineales bacterium]
MPYASQLMSRPIADLDGEVIGSLSEIFAQQIGDISHPKIVAIEAKKGSRSLYISIHDVVALIAPAIALNKRKKDIRPYKPGENDLYLIRDVLDKQIIDTNGVRVVRVNDLEITRVENDFFIANVDTSSSGLLRRLGLSAISKRLPSKGKRGTESGIISWEDVELLSGDQPMRLKVPGEKLAELHPADLAEILSDLSRQEGRDIIESLDIETLADTLEEVEPDFQVSLLEGMDDERVADVLEEMEPDEAADLLAELPEDRSQELLELMEDEEAEDVRKLLSYPVDTAGGLMTTEYITIPPDITAEQAMAILREQGEDAEVYYYIYVLDSGEHLIGVLSLRELVIAQPQTKISDIMVKRVVTVHLEDSQDECAQSVAKYDLVAIPVVDDDKVLHGIVTADDAIDKIIPTAWKKRLPRLYH